MKNMYKVTRPAWAGMETLEFRTILYITLAFLIFSGTAQILRQRTIEDRDFKDKHPKALVAYEVGWPIVEAVVLSFGCVVVISWYQKQRIGVYPRTFVYAFYMPKGAVTSGNTRVVGYCHVRPIMETGKIVVQGASYQWDDGRLSKRVGYKSTYAYGVKDDDEQTTCNIQFTIDENQEERLYRHGLLQFRLVDNQLSDEEKDAVDSYAGYLQSTQKRSELQDVDVRSKGYAESFRDGLTPENQVQLALADQGGNLLANLDRLLRTKPWPSLWPPEDPMLPEDGVTLRKTNFWGHHIPTPQSVVLKEELRPHIDKLLTDMLSLVGLDAVAIQRFKRYAISQAELDPNDSKASYESDLKKELVHKTVDWIKDRTLTHRANVIAEQIKPFLVRGGSLLDIGCGNGLITDLIRSDFSEIQCIDVVRYLPASLRLPFMQYIEGDPLPIKGPFDTVLLLTVLHHATDPVALLKKAWAATSKRLIIIESVVGVHKPEPSARYDLISLPDEDQVGYAAFVDWFYNRVLHDNVPVPYNFTTPERWQSVFLQQSMPLTETVYLGQDIDIGPEYHVLFVLERQEAEQGGPQLVQKTKPTVA